MCLSSCCITTTTTPPKAAAKRAASPVGVTFMTPLQGIPLAGKSHANQSPASQNHCPTRIGWETCVMNVAKHEVCGDYGLRADVAGYGVLWRVECHKCRRIRCSAACSGVQGVINVTPT